VFTKKEKLAILRKINKIHASNFTPSKNPSDSQKNMKRSNKFSQNLHLVRPTYSSKHEYYAVYHQLVTAESSTDKELNNKKSRNHVFVNFQENHHTGGMRAFVKYPDVHNFDPGYFIGTQISLSKAQHYAKGQ
jgi:hypothetical protein